MAAKPQTLSSKTFSELSSELAECKQTMFDRYDIDRSGTLNSAKELRQLCTNLCIKLQLTIKVETIEEWCQDAGEMEQNCWKVDEFETWFKNTFIQRLGQPDAESEANAAAAEEAPDEAEKELIQELHKYELENDEEYCWVMIFPNEEDEKRASMAQEEKDAMKAAREDALFRMLRAGLAIKLYKSADGDELVVEIGAPQRFLEFVGTQLKIPIKFSRMIKDPDDPTKEILKEGYEPFDMTRINDFAGASGEWTKGKFYFRSKPRAQIVLAIMTDRWDPDANKFGAHIDSGELIAKGHLKHCFAAHGPLLSSFDEIWSRFGLIFQFCCCSSVPEGKEKIMPWEQPIDNIRDYFGERLAMYFSFLGFYTHALISPTLWGAAAGCLQFIFQDSAPLIAEWAVVGYCIQIVVWATIFLENWKRKQAENAHRWGMRGLTTKEIPLPAFEGKYDPMLETLVYDLENETSRSCKIAGAAGMVFICLLTVAGTMTGFTILQNILNYVNPNAGTLVGIVNAICIIVFNDLYKNLAAVLTTWENHRTETEFNNNLVLKCFLFQFINSYFSLYITAFIKPWTHEKRPAYWNNGTFTPKVEANTLWTLFGSCSCKTYKPASCWDDYGANAGPYVAFNGTWDQCDDSVCSNLPEAMCSCDELNCKWDVAVLLITVFGIQIVWGNISEIIVPQIVFYFKNKADDGELLKKNEVPDEPLGPKSPAEIEAVMPNYEEYVYAGIFDDYNELVLQFGFVTLFATNFPFVGVLAFLNNLIEIRSDAFKFVHVYRRPTPRPCEKIGTWYTVMEIMTFAAVTTNCANVFFVSDFSKDLAFSTRVFGMFAAEHCAYFLKFLIAAAIDDVAPEIAREIEYEDCIKEKALYEDVCRRVNEVFADVLKEHRNPEIEPPKHFAFASWEPPPGYVEKGRGGLVFPTTVDTTTKEDNPLSKGESLELKEVVTHSETPSWVTVEEGGTFTMEDGVKLTNGEGASCKIENGATLKLETGSMLHVGDGGVMIVESKATVTIEDQTELIVGNGAEFKVENNAKLIIENNAEFKLTEGAKFTLQSNSEAKFENSSEVQQSSKTEFVIQNDAKFLLETNGEMQIKEGASAVFENKSNIKVMEGFILVVTENLLVETGKEQVFNEVVEPVTA
jgi:hypothetical protein